VEKERDFYPALVQTKTISKLQNIFLKSLRYRHRIPQYIENLEKKDDIMQRFKKILLVYDDTEKGKSSLNRAVDLATRNKARLTIIDVIEGIPQDSQMLIAALHPQEIIENAVKKQKNRLEQYIAPLLESGLNANAKVLVGKEFIEIIREVLRNDHDLVIKTARGKGGVRDILFGSTAMHLMRKCPCPTLVMKPERSQRYNRILAAVDVTPAAPKVSILNTKIMDLATSLTQLDESELHIIHAWDIPYEHLMRERVDTSPAEIEKWEKEAGKLPKRYLDDLLKKYALKKIKHQVHLLKGKASWLIPELVEKKRINLIVMGTLCRTGIPGFLIGNTAEKILHRVNCSVLTIKPEDFVTPVTLDEG
jgi:nucleotide-binding universal stress UspA family protein